MSSVGSVRESEADQSAIRIARMQVSDLDEVVLIENAIYPFPWSYGNFLDSIQSGYETWTARDESNQLLGYFLLMYAVDEAHLLNITVGADFQGQGVGLMLLGKAVQLARIHGTRSVLLEVRPSNERAQLIYRRYGFAEIGFRRNYYPAPGNTREDAIVMRMPI